MLSRDFKVGDRVLITQKYWLNKCFDGMHGVVAIVNRADIGVDFGIEILKEGRRVATNNLGGLLKSRTGYFFDNRDYDWHIDCVSLIKDDVEFEF